MMSAHKKSNPILREVLVTSLQLVLGIIGGVALCAAWLIFKPVTIMDSPPGASRTPTDKHEVVYVRGRPALRGNQGARKQKAFLDKTPGELMFGEEDLNRWLAGAYGSKERAFEIKGTGATITPRVPAARIVGDELEVGLEISFERGETNRSFVAQARGRFAERNGQQIFVPRQVYLGSCPLPWNLGGRELYHQLMGLFPVPANVTSAWSEVSQVAVAENRLHVVMGNVAAAAPVATNPPAPAPTPTPAAIEPAAATAPASDVAATAATETAPSSATTEPITPAATEPSDTQPAEPLPADQPASTPASTEPTSVPAEPPAVASTP